MNMKLLMRKEKLLIIIKTTSAQLTNNIENVIDSEAKKKATHSDL